MGVFASHLFVIVGAFTWTMQVLAQHQHLDFAYFGVETRRQRMRHIGFRRFRLADMRFRAQRPHRAQQIAEPSETADMLIENAVGESDDRQ